MIAVTHLAVGAAAGLWSARLAGTIIPFESPSAQLAIQTGTALVIGTASHIVLDAIPHNDEIYKTGCGTALVLIPELVVVLSVIFGLVIFRNLSPIIIFAGVIGAAWLDLFSMLGIMHSVHGIFHSAHDPGMIGSLITQLVIAVIALIFLF